ncbi:MAG: manganese transporter [Bacteroidetes bacterium]|nr:MAG: manganese transporter [Bacteroidota bacterium]
MKKLNVWIGVMGLLFLVTACHPGVKKGGILKVVSTTTMIDDMVTNIGGDKVEAEVIMGAGVDPHLYKASENDVNAFHRADIIFYNGLHLEGKLVDLFERMEKGGKAVYAVSEKIPGESLISSEAFSGNYDPHIWFDIALWQRAARAVYDRLVEHDPDNQAYFFENYSAYVKRLGSLDEKLKALIENLAPSQRILVTAHDAFNYFGQAYGFEVVGLQGISTVSEAGVKDVQNLTQFIIAHGVKAIFVESSVPKKNIKALQEALKAKGFEVLIGGELFSDALGSANTPEATYEGMFLYNVGTIVNALK